MGFISGQHSTFHIVYSKIPFEIAFCLLFIIKLFIVFFLHWLPLLVCDIDAVSFIQQLNQSHTISIINILFPQTVPHVKYTLHLLTNLKHCVTGYFFCLLNINKVSIILSLLKIHLNVNFDGSSLMPENSSTYFFWTYCQAPHGSSVQWSCLSNLYSFFRTYPRYYLPL